MGFNPPLGVEFEREGEQETSGLPQCPNLTGRLILSDTDQGVIPRDNRAKFVRMSHWHWFTGGRKPAID